jgi:hypothetical protein
MTELRTLIDEWLDELPSASAVEPSDGLVGLHASSVGEAVLAGRRLRRKQRTMVIGAVAAAAATIAAAAGVLTGVGTVTTVPRPPAGTTTPHAGTTMPAATETTASSRSLGTTAPGPGARPMAVTYPDGAGGTRTVTWPAPAAGIPWAVREEPPSDLSPGPSAILAGKAGTRQLQLSLLAAVPGSIANPGAAVDVPLGLVHGKTTAFWTEVSLPSGRQGAAEQLAQSYSVMMTRGGVTVRPIGFDFCGTWPDDVAALGEGPVIASVFFELSGPRTCSLRVADDGQVLVHLAVQPGVQHGAGDPPPQPMQLVSFTIRPDGTAVSATAVAPAATVWTAANVHREFDALDRLVQTLPYPAAGQG